MCRMKRLAAVLSVLFGVLPALSAAARAGETGCVALGNGNLLIPDGTSCTLRHVIVAGNVVVGQDSGLRVADEVTILGNLLIDRCDYVSFEPSADARIAVAGNVEIRHCAEASGKPFTAGRLTIGGNFLCRDNAAPCFAVALTVGGNAEFARNAGGMSFVEGNTIGGDLACAGNTGVSDYGDPNSVAGKKLGECAGLSD